MASPILLNSLGKGSASIYDSASKPKLCYVGVAKHETIISNVSVGNSNVTWRTENANSPVSCRVHDAYEFFGPSRAYCKTPFSPIVFFPHVNFFYIDLWSFLVA